jgi:large subunit ribosomal protein L25
MAADQITLTAETGRPIGSRSSRRLRREGKVPAVVYGSGSEPTAIAVQWSDLRAALITEAGMNALITLDVDGDERLTIVKDMQRHPVRRDVTHVDFVVIDRNVAIDVDVPVVLEDTEGDNLAGLVLDQQLFTLAVSAKPGAIPNELVVSVAALTVDEPIRVGDVELPEGVELNVDPDEAIVTASLPMSEEALLADVEEQAGDTGDADADADVAEGETAEGGDDAEADAGEAGGEEA